MTQLSVRVDDEELEAFLADRENNSETVRTALRYLRAQQVGVDDGRLTDHQRAAYQWLRDRVGVGGTVSVSMAENQLSQQLSVDMEMVRGHVLRPLESHGYTRVQSHVQTALITVLPPSSSSSEGPTPSTAVDAPEDASETLDAIAAAGEEVAEGAD